MSTVVLDTITGKSTATTITIGSTPVISASANSMTIRGEGSAQTSIQSGLCKCWTNYTGITTTASRDSFNVSSLTDDSTGRTTININNDMANANYTGFFYNNGSASTGYENFNNDYTGGMGSFATGSFGNTAYGGTSGFIDCHRNFTGIFGDLA